MCWRLFLFLFLSYQNTTTIDVTVQDSDMNGLSFDVIDHISQNFTVQVGANVTDAQETEVVLKNIVTYVKLYLFHIPQTFSLFLDLQ